MNHFLIVLLLFVNFSVYTQVIDNFADLDFTANPTWTGNPIDFTVNATTQVQLNATVAGTSYLSTPHNLVSLDNQEWHVWTKIASAPSAGNFGRYYLTSASSDLTTNPNGFYLQLGEAGSTDAVRLMKSVAGVSTQICASADGTIATSFTIGIKVNRDDLGNWILAIDFAGGTNYSQVATGTDAANLIGSHIGYSCTYSLGNISKYYFDEVYVGNEIIDTEPPTVVSVTAMNADLIDVLFSEPLDQTTAEDINSYDIQPFLSATTSTLDGTNPALVHLVPSVSLTNGNTYNLITQGIQDLVGNASVSEQNQFAYYLAETPSFGDIIINEFMCDPSPVIGLPELEFVEVYNRSDKVFNLQNWKLGDNSTFGTVTGSNWLLPGEYKILCATAALVDYTNGTAVTSFPSLNNSTDDIVLVDDLGNIVDKITYTIEWYNDPMKQDGGYSIERINPVSLCSGIDNWRASNNVNGGTPGSVNSVNDLTPDTQAPIIIETFATNAIGITVYFSEGMDSLSLVNANLIINPGLTEQNRIISGIFPESMQIQFMESLVPSQTYTYTLQSIEDCSNNSATGSGEFALADSVHVGDVIINEILFDPLTGGNDWVELYNNTDKLLNLNGWIFANFDNDTIANNKVITTNYLLKPRDYVVIGSNIDFVMQNYPAAVPGKFLSLALPSLNTDSSTLYLMLPGFPTNSIMDKLSYSEDWHFKLLDSDKGKSLERMNPDALTQDKNNWHTAAEAIGFATPGRENSQYYPAISSGTVSFTSEIISPDNDGFEDVLQINYELETPGLVGTISIFDDRGRKIRALASSELLGVTGTITWDGVNDEGSKASIGTYVLIFEAFQVDGGMEFVSKKAFVVAGKI